MISNTNASPSLPDGGVDATVDQSKDTPTGRGGSSSGRQRQPSLLDSLLVGPDIDKSTTDAGFGILCNDPTGLCLSATGSFVKKGNSGSSNINVNSGVYTSLTKLAQQLQQPGATHTTAAPLITIETEESNLLIKEYDGHAIALKVPALRAGSSGGGNPTGGENQSHPDATSSGGS